MVATGSSLFYDAAASLMVASMVMGDLTVPANSTERLNCTLAASQAYEDQLSTLMSGPPVKLIEMDIVLIGHPPDTLKTWLKGTYKPYRWVRSTGREGQSLLMLEENYSLMSLTALSIGVARMAFNITEHPHACLKNLSPDDVIMVLRKAFLSDFKIRDDIGKHSLESPLGQDEAICNMHVVNNDGYAVFRYQCCHEEKNGNILCQDIMKKGWIEVLLTLILLIKILILLYSPMFLPESFYRFKYIACQYVYNLPNDSELPLNIVVTEEPQLYGDDYQKKTVRLAKLPQMEYFKTLVSSNCWHLDKLYEVKVKDVRLSVKARRLLGRSKVPVGVFKMIYNNFFRCRIRNLEALKFCCNSSILGRFTPTGVKMMRWSECMRFFATFCQLVIIASPWVIRLLFYGLYERDMLKERFETAESVGLSISYTGSLVLYLTPVHALFILIYIIIVVDSLIYGVITQSLREKLNVVLRQCLRDMRERSRIAVCSWAAKMMVVPFAIFGLLAFIIFPLYLIVVGLILLPVIAFYMFPTINLTVRLLIHLFIFMCPKSVGLRAHRWSDKLTGLKERLLIKEVTARESFVKRTYHNSMKGIILQLYTIILCLLSFWSVTLLLTEIVSFFVEVLCYTFMGVVVNAGVTLQYCTVIGLVFWHDRSSCARVHTLYRDYHKLIHDQILAMKKEEIDAVARLTASEQQHTAFRVVGQMSSLAPRLDRPVLRVKKNIPKWVTPGMLAFLSRHDISYTPEKFFSNTINLDYFGCPGPVYFNVLKASWDFAKIVLFLCFVLIIVLAFGDAYQISSANQLLATVVGGIIPFFFNHFFKSESDASGFDKNSIQFMTEFHAAINRFEQAWPVYDIVPSSFKELESSGRNTEPHYLDKSSIDRKIQFENKTHDHHRNNPVIPTKDLQQNVQMNSTIQSENFSPNNFRTNVNSILSESEISKNEGRRRSSIRDENTNSIHGLSDIVTCSEVRSEHEKVRSSIDIDSHSTNNNEESTIDMEANTITRHSNKQSISLPLLGPSSSSSSTYPGVAFENLNDDNPTNIHLIVDVSTSKSKRRRGSTFRRKNNMESGSVSMLDFNSQHKNTGTIYTPTPSVNYQENLV